MRPKILALIAPAGFGKSSLVQQHLNGPSGTCDCRGARSELDLARRMLRALAEEAPHRRDSLERSELALADGGSSVAERVGAVLAAWRTPSAGTIVFEHAESLADAAASRTLFAHALGSLPAGRSVVICSRGNLGLHLTRFAAPHEIVVLRPADLAFDAAAVREIFAPDDVNETTVERILALSGGWPAAVLLLRRFDAEGHLEAVLDRPGELAFEEFCDYVADEVLSPLGDRLERALFACAAIPHAMPADLHAALEDDAAVAEAERFSQESPFLSRGGDGSFAVHPILASMLIARGRDRRMELLETVARRHETAHRFERAAELHLARGDREAAADALGRHEVELERSLTPSYARVIYGLDRTRILRYPRLWSATCLRRLYCVETAALLDEAESVWRMMAPATPVLERFYVLALRVKMMTEVGRFDEATSTIDEFTAMPEAGSEPVASWIAYLRALVAAQLGRLGEAERALTAALPNVAGMDVPAYETFLALGSDVARARGERALERQFLDRADDLARRSTLGNAVARGLAEAAIGAWLWGEDEAVAQLSGELSEWVARSSVTGLAYLSAEFAGSEASPGSADAPRHVAFGRMIAAARTADDAQAAEHARAAERAAEAYGAPFVRCLAALAVAFCDPSAFDDATARAVAAAGCCDSPALQGAVDAIAQRRERAGFLDAFADRFTRARHSAGAAVEIELASGAVRVRGRDVRLAGREAELLFALASRREPTARTRLAALLWPELDEDAARNALSVCLHRLRRSIGRGAVVREGEGYRLCKGARVDVWEIEQTLSAVRARRRLDDADRLALSEFARRLAAPRPDRMERWEWFEPLGRRLDALRVDVSHRLGADALERGDAAGALVRAQEILAHDPFDEPAREMEIRAHLAIGDRAAAVRSYRQYREMLAVELQCEPSPALTQLVYS